MRERINWEKERELRREGKREGIWPRREEAIARLVDSQQVGVRGRLNSTSGIDFHIRVIAREMGEEKFGSGASLGEIEGGCREEGQALGKNSVEGYDGSMTLSQFRESYVDDHPNKLGRPVCGDHKHSRAAAEAAIGLLPQSSLSRHLKKERSELPLKWPLEEDWGRRPTIAAAAARRCAAAAPAAETVASSCPNHVLPTRLIIP